MNIGVHSGLILLFWLFHCWHGELIYVNGTGKNMTTLVIKQDYVSHFLKYAASIICRFMVLFEKSIL
jgi:hypothetical protein